MRRTLAIAATLALAATAWGKDIKVDSAAEIKSALKSAKAGDTILIKPGTYDMGGPLSLGNAGTAKAPITLAADGAKGYATLKIPSGTVGFRMNRRFWLIRGLHIQGSDKVLDLIQVDGTQGGGDLRLVDCRISTCKEFLIKASRSREKAADHVVLDHCEWFDVPGTAIDLVSGDNWIIRGNYVHDYGKGGGVHYGIFLKGGGKNGLIEGNLVDGGGRKITVGISFGGGLTGAKWLPLGKGDADGKVAAEHADGIARNNIVVNTADCAYHTNNGSNCKFYNNLAYHCGAGFQRQASYPPDATLINNVLSGRATGVAKAEHNLTKAEKAWFVAPEKNDFRLTDAGKAALAGKGGQLKSSDNPTDYLGQPRKGHDLGPVNPDAKTTTAWVDRRK